MLTIHRFLPVACLVLICCLLFAPASQAAQLGTATVGDADYANGGMAYIPQKYNFLPSNNIKLVLANPAGTTAWLISDDVPSQIFQVDVATMTVSRTGPLTGVNGVQSGVIDGTASFCYLASVSSGQISKVNLATLQLVATLRPNTLSLGNLAIDAQNLYGLGEVVTSRTPVVARIPLASFAIAQTLQVPNSGISGNFFSSAIDLAHKRLYAIDIIGSDIELRRIDLTSFTLGPSLHLGIGRIPSVVLHPAGTFAYLSDVELGDILRVNLQDFATTKALDLTNTQIGKLCLDSAGTQGMVLDSRGNVYIVDLSSLTAATTLGPFAYLRNSFNFASTAPVVGDRVLIGTNTVPGLYDRIGFDLSHTGPTFLAGGETSLQSMTTDADVRFGYVACGDTFPVIVKVDLLRQRRITQKLLDPVHRPIGPGTSDGRYIYFGMSRSTDAGEINLVQIDPDLMQETGRASGPHFTISALDYNPFTNKVYAALCEGSGGHMGYFNPANFGAFTPLTTLGLNEFVTQLCVSKSSDQTIFAEANARRITNDAGGVIFHGSTYADLVDGAVLNQATGNVYAAEGRGIIHELSTPNMQETGSVDVSQFDPTPGGQLRPGAADPVGRFVLFPNNSRRMVKYELNTTGAISAVNMGSSVAAAAPVIDPEGANAYVPGFNMIDRVALTPRGRLEGTRVQVPGPMQVDTVNFWARQAVGPRRVEVLPLGNQVGGLGGACIDKVHNRAWYGTLTSPGRVLQFDCTTRDLVNSMTLRTGENTLRSAVMGPGNDFAYFGTSDSPGKIIKVRLSDNTRNNVLTLDTGENGANRMRLDPTGQFIYVATSSTPIHIVKVRLSDFTRVDGITLNTGENAGGGLAIDPAGKFMYVTAQPSGFGKGQLVKVQLTPTLARVAALSLTADFAGEVAVDPANAFAVTMGGFRLVLNAPQPPGIIERIRLSDFTKQGSDMTLQSDEPGASAPTFTAEGTTLLLLVSGTAPKLVRIDWPSFIREDGVTLRPATETGGTSLLLGSGSLAFVGTTISPGRIITLDLAPKPLRLGIFTKVNSYYTKAWESQPLALPNADEWISVPIAQGTPGKLKLGAGEAVLAWQCDADEKVPAHQFGNFREGLRLAWDFGSFPAQMKPSNLAPFDQTTSWTSTVSRWSMYLDTTDKNAAQGWERLP